MKEDAMVEATSPAMQTYYGFVVRRTTVNDLDWVQIGQALGEMLGTKITVCGVEEGTPPDDFGECGGLLQVITEELPCEAMYINVNYHEV